MPRGLFSESRINARLQCNSSRDTRHAREFGSDRCLGYLICRCPRLCQDFCWPSSLSRWRRISPLPRFASSTALCGTTKNHYYFFLAGLADVGTIMFGMNAPGMHTLNSREGIYDIFFRLITVCALSFGIMTLVLYRLHDILVGRGTMGLVVIITTVCFFYRRHLLLQVACIADTCVPHFLFLRRCAGPRMWLSRDAQHSVLHAPHHRLRVDGRRGLLSAN